MSSGTSGGRLSPAVLTLSELTEVSTAIRESGEFVFDLETRGDIHRDPEVLDYIEEEWQNKLKTLKSTNPDVLAKSKAHIEERWTKELALDPLRNTVTWIGIAVEGKSWAIPLDHPNGELLTPAEIGDGSTVPPPGYRRKLKNGKESMAKARYYIPATFSQAPEQLTHDQVMEVLAPLFMDPDITKVNQNIKFDAKSIAKYLGGDLPAGKYVDTQVLQHIMDENLESYSLQNILKHQFQGFDPYHEEGKIGKKINLQPFSSACKYVHLDARWTWLLYQRLMRRISRDAKLVKVMHLETDTTRVLCQMETNGIAVDRRAMSRLGKELQKELNENLLAMVDEGAFLGFNPDSVLDKRLLFFGKKSEGGLGFKPTKKTDKGAPSTDAKVLEKLSGKHPLVDLVLKHQELKKTISTYVGQGMEHKLHNGRLHPQFHLHRAATGRLSSSGPNLQNIPRDGAVRSLFVAEEGDMLCVADYSQIELRIMCMLSEDPEMSKIFIEATSDMHTATAAAVLRKDVSEITPEERQLYGKMPNFLIGYGGGAPNLAEQADIPLEQAEEVIDTYKETFSGIFKWKEEVIRFAHRNGYTETMHGRRRRLRDALDSQNKYDRYRAERQAVNHVVQGTASEICKVAMVKLDGLLDFPACKMLVQVHDEIVLSVPESDTEHWIRVMEEAMGDGTSILGIPLEVTGSAARSWYDAK